MNRLDAAIKSLSALRNHLRAYSRTKDIFRQYRALDEKIYRAHKEDIDIHRAAIKALSHVEKPVPNSKTVTAEIERLRVVRADINARYSQNESKRKEMEVTPQNLYSIAYQNQPREQSRSNDLSI